MGTPGAVMLFTLPPLLVYAVAYWFGVMGKPRQVPAPAPRTTALDNAFERFERQPIKRTRDGKFAKRKPT